MTIINWASETLPSPLLRLLRPAYMFTRQIGQKISGVADALRLINPDDIYDDQYYRKRRSDPLRTDARNVAIAIQKYFEPDSVIDFGCAIGTHLEPFYEEGIHIKGIDGNQKGFEYAVIPNKHLDQHDLRDPYTPNRQYDLALCFEVAEHIPARFADVLVRTLAQSSETVVMTAAPPGQDGAHHVNTQPQLYWVGKFRTHGMELDSEAVNVLRDTISVERSVWIPDNLMVFSTGQC